MASFLVLLVLLLLISMSGFLGLIAMAIGRAGKLPNATGFLWGSALGPLGVFVVAVYVIKQKSESFRSRSR